MVSPMFMEKNYTMIRNGLSLPLNLVRVNFYVRAHKFQGNDLFFDASSS